MIIRGGLGIVLLAVGVKADAEQDAMVDKVADRLMDKFSQRAIKESSLYNTNLDNTTMAKAGAVTGVAPRTAVAQAMGARSFMGSRQAPCKPVIKYGCSFPNPGSPYLENMIRSVRTYASVGDKFPKVEVDKGFPPTKVNLGDRLKGKKTILVGLPGAFTPT